MKTRLYIITFLLLNILPASAIDVISLNKAMPVDNVRVTAGQEITLLPGFTASAYSGGTFHARIGTPSEVYPLTLLPQTEPSQNRNFIHTRTFQTADALQYLDQIQYYDGLGRPDELVLRGITPTGSDLASLTEYDAFGRAYKQWLPAPVQGNGDFVNPATLKNTATSHYSDSRPFSETVFENSPLNRVIAQKGAGAVWDNKAITTAYGANVGEVPNFTVNNGQLVRNGNYPDNHLYKTTTTDEDGKTTAEYKDKLGRVVMTMSSTDVKTVYVYNDLGQLEFVLPPLAVDGLSANATIPNSHDVLRKYAYLYRYDERGNVVEKRLPGCEPVYMVYDKANRLIFSQDGNQRTKNEWTFNKYDAFGRLILSGIYPTTQTRQALKTKCDNIVVSESRGGYYGYTWNCLPEISYTGTLIVNHYDDYEHLLEQETFFRQHLSYTSKDGFVNQPSNAKGLLTGTRIKLLDGSGELVTAMYYDAKGQMIQSRATNHLGGFDFTYNAYNFAGNITKTRHEHSANNSTLNSEYTYSYDHAGRLKTTTCKLGDNPTVTLAANTYDELGRLAQKQRHNSADTEQAQYNIRNQPTKLTSGGFEQNLYYNTNLPGGAMAQFNGNIAATTWTYNGTTRGYNYTYDVLNRLQQATFKRGNSDLWDGNWNEGIAYDKHGNITSLYRAKEGNDIDNLYMNYDGCTTGPCLTLSI